MNTNFKTYLLSSAFALLMVQSCKEKETTTPTPTQTNEEVYSQTQSADNSNVESSVDEVMNKIDGQINTAGARLESSECGIVNTTITGTKKSFKFTFVATSCPGVNSKTGEVILTLESGDKFGDIGSVWKKQYKNIVVTTKENKTLTFNGDVYLTNVTGGFPINVFTNSGKPIIHRIKSNNMSIKFDTTVATRQFNIARKYTWSYVGNKVTGTIEGDSSINGYDKLILWGKNRFGQEFYSQLKTPAVFGLACVGRPISASRTNTIVLKEGNIVTEENVTTDENTCAMTYNATLTYGGKTYTYSVTKLR